MPLQRTTPTCICFLVEARAALVEVCRKNSQQRKPTLIRITECFRSRVEVGAKSPAAPHLFGRAFTPPES